MRDCFADLPIGLVCSVDGEDMVADLELRCGVAGGVLNLRERRVVKKDIVPDYVIGSDTGLNVCECFWTKKKMTELVRADVQCDLRFSD